MLNKTMCLLSLSLLTISTISIKTPFVAEVENKVNLKEIVQINSENDLRMNKLRVQNREKTNVQVWLKKQQIIKLEEERLKQKQKEQSKQWQEFELTFYTSLNCENSKHGAINCQGQKLSRGMVANNKIKQNTKIYLEGYGEVIVSDKGSNKFFNNFKRLDVFIEREPEESDSHYLNRVNGYGIKKVKGYIINR